MLTANKTALQGMASADPVLVDIAPASEVVPGMSPELFLHAGPPIDYESMCAPMKGAVCCALINEGFAADPAAAVAIASAGAVRFEPCHAHSAVGPMTGLTSFSMPVWVLEDRASGRRAYVNVSEGQGVGLRFGEYDPATIARLDWIKNVFAPVFHEVLTKDGPVELTPLMAEALAMGDELHMRNIASTSLFIKRTAAAVVRRAGARAGEVIRFMSVGNDQFFLNLAMGAAKLIADAGDGVRGSSIVTAIARNGVETGIRISGLPGRWFTAPAPMVDGLFFPGRTAADANPDIGDSAIMETAGFGGAAMAAAPAIVRLFGRTDASIARRTTENAYKTACGVNERFPIPAMDFRGTPLGIDALAVVETGLTPVLDTAIAARRPGVGMVGAGMAVTPLKPFEEAVLALASELEV